MSAVALIKLAQGASTPAAGIALAGVPTTTVEVTNDVNDGVASWRIDLLYGPPGSATYERDPGDPLVLAQDDDDDTPYASFPPDVGFDGECYRIRLTVWDGPNYTGSSDVDIRCFAIPRGALNAVFPPNQIDPDPLTTKPNELNFNDQPYHWSGPQAGGAGGVRLVNALLAALVDEAGGNVDSVFGRTGDVVAEAGDYEDNQITNTSSVAGAFVDDAIDQLNLDKADKSITLTAGAGLTGGGDLSNNRNFAVGANPDGSIVVNADDIQVGEISDAQHGLRGSEITGSPMHSIATALIAGFMSAAMFTKLDGIEAGAEVNVVTSVHTRIGDVVSAVGDYDSDEVDNASTVTGSSVSDALETLDSDIQAHIGTGGTSEHPLAIASGLAGFMSGADKAKLDGIAAGAVADHGALSGLSDDDHTQYILVSGARGFSGVVAGQTPTASAHLTTKGYVDGLVQGLDWRPSVLDQATAPPGGETGGERYLVIATATGAFAGHEDDIAEYNGSSWDFYTPDDGWAVWVEDVNQLWTYNGSAWVRFGSTVDHGSLIGLADDDHTQYLLVTGTRAMSGGLNMGGNAITNVGNVDGRDVSADGAALDAHLINYSNPHAVTTTQIGAVPTTRQVIAGDGLTGGGALSSDVTIDVSYGSAPANVWPGQTQGAGSSDDVARIDHTHANYSWRTTNPVNVDASTPTPGSDNTYARGDHKHQASVGAGAEPVTLGGSGSGGSASTLSRSDHEHAIALGSPIALVAGGSNDDGVADAVARADHKHGITAGIAYTIGTANAIGSLDTFSRSDHIHSHGSQPGGSLHALAISGGAAGFMSGTDKQKLDTLGTGDLYVLLAGRSGGQLVHGGTAASEDLVLRGTSNATPGVVQLDSSNFDLNGNQVVNGANHIIGYQAGNLDVGNDSYSLDLNGTTVSIQTGGLDRINVTNTAAHLYIAQVYFDNDESTPWFNQQANSGETDTQQPLRVQAQSNSHVSADNPGGRLELAPGYSAAGVGSVEFLLPTGASQTAVSRGLTVAFDDPGEGDAITADDVYITAWVAQTGTLHIETQGGPSGVAGGGIVVHTAEGLGDTKDIEISTGNASGSSGNINLKTGTANSTHGSLTADIAGDGWWTVAVADPGTNVPAYSNEMWMGVVASTWNILTLSGSGGGAGGDIVIGSDNGLGSSGDVTTKSGNAQTNSGDVIEWIGNAGSTLGHWRVQAGTGPTEWARIGEDSGEPFLSFGTSPASQGIIRAGGDFSIYSEGAGDADLRLIEWTVSDTTIRIGYPSVVNDMAFFIDNGAGNDFRFYHGGSSWVLFADNGATYVQRVNRITFYQEYDATNGSGSTHTVNYSNGLKQYVLVDTGDAIEFQEPPSNTLFNMMLRIHNNTAMSALTFDSSGSANVVAALGSIDVAGGDEEETTLGVYWDGTQWHLTSSPNESHSGGAPSVNFV